MTILDLNRQAARNRPERPGLAVRLENVTIAYDRHPAVHHLSGLFAAGSLTALVGPNGAGKSSLIRAIAGLLPLSSGRISLGEAEHVGDSAVHGASFIGYLPQVTEVDRTFPLTALDVVALGHWRKCRTFLGIGLGRLDAGHRQASLHALDLVGLRGFENRPIAALSVGQFQRVLFARLIVQDAALILLDEPFNAVDQRTVADLVALIEDWHRAGRTVIAALHDLDLVRRHFPDALLLAREPIAWGPSQQVLTEENLLRARVLAESWRDEAAAICRIPA